MARGEPECRATVAQSGPTQQLRGGNPARPERHQPHAGGDQQQDSPSDRGHQRCPRPTERGTRETKKTDWIQTWKRMILLKELGNRNPLKQIIIKQKNQLGYNDWI